MRAEERRILAEFLRFGVLPQRHEQTRQRADARARCDDAAEVQRIGRGDMRCIAGRAVAANFSKQLDGLGAGELLAHESGYEAPAANLSLCFHAPERH